MNNVALIAGTAAIIGLTHTLLGPDHYLPFIVLSKARKWSYGKTMLITFLSGLGHVMSSVVLGFVGILIGTAVFKLESIESVRGEIAGWLLIAFGLVYFVWGLRRAIKNKPHTHKHFHEDGTAHEHEHRHTEEHAHPHDEKKKSLTPWIIFLIFVFGPCEPLIPLVMYPAAQHNIPAVILVAGVFAIATIGTMLIVVTVTYFGLSKVHFHKLERYSHALAGMMIFLSGTAINFLGL